MTSPPWTADDLDCLERAEENERRIRAVLALPDHEYGTGWYSAMMEVRAILTPTDLCPTCGIRRARSDVSPFCSAYCQVTGGSTPIPTDATGSNAPSEQSS